MDPKKVLIEIKALYESELRLRVQELVQDKKDLISAKARIREAIKNIASLKKAITKVTRKIGIDVIA